MGDPADLHAALVARLQGLEHVTTYDGYVPDRPAAEPTTGRVYPYVVVWPSAGYTAGGARSVTTDAAGALEWPVQVTVAAGDPTWCLQAAHTVRSRLEGHVLAPGAGPLLEEPGAPQVQPDPAASPPRWFVAVLFRALTA